MLPLAVILLLIPFVLPIASLVAQLRVRRRVRTLEQTSAQQQRTIEELTARLVNLQLDLKSRPPETAQPPQPTVEKAPHGQPAPERREPTERLVPPTPTAPPVRPSITAADEPRPTPPSAKPSAERPAMPPKPVAPPVASVPPRLPPPVHTPPAGPTRPRFDWEQLVGVKMFSAVAGVALVLAAVFFLRYSMDRGWLSPSVRVVIGLITGVGLLVVCDLKAARRYPITANALDAAAIAILFSTFFAAHALWNLISSGVAFGMLGLVTAVAVLLSIRRDSIFIAVLGLLGGFATPVLLSTGENRPIPLFAYLLLLNIGLAWVAYRKTWPLLTILTFVLTTLYQWGWVLRFLSTAVEQVPLAMGIFIVFAIGGFVALSFGAGGGDKPGLSRLVGPAGLAAAFMPLVFAVYLAAVPAYGARAALLFGFLLLIDVALFFVAVGRREDLPHVMGAGTTMLAFGVWLAVSYASSAGTTAIVFVSASSALYALAPIAAARFGRPFASLGRGAVYAAPILLFVFVVIAGIDRNIEPIRLFVPLVALFALISWRALSSREPVLYFVAAFFVVIAEGSWSAHLTADRVRIAFVVYLVFAVFQIAVAVIARRLERPFRPAWGAGAFLIASTYLLFFLATGPRATAALWFLALLLAVLNAGLFVESAAVSLPPVSVIGGVLSWTILAVWWLTASATVGLLPSLLVVVGFALVTLLGNVWAHARTRAVGFRDALLLGLVAHLFLYLVTLQPEWALPPWPLFAALGVLTLALSAASLGVRSNLAHIAGVAATALIVLAWAQERPPAWAPWILIAAEATVAYALAWQFLVAKRDQDLTPAVGSALVIFIAEFTLIAADASSSPLRTLTHAVNISIVLWLAWQNQWKWIATAAVVPAWLVFISWQGQHNPRDWPTVLMLPVVLYAVFTAYPFVLGKRARGSRDPFFTAIAGSVFFFFAARAALLQGGLDAYLGVAPVVEGAILALLLRKLLQMEPSGTRDLGRLALVAGSALAFATVAIPLQLRHQWITIGWAFEAAALAWVYRRIPHRGLFYWSTALLTFVFARLALNPQIFAYEPRGYRVFNWYLYTYLACGVACLIAARFLSTTNDRILPKIPRVSALLPAAGVILFFLLLNIEIADFYATGPEITFRFGVTLAQDLTYTIGWLVFGMALLTAGIYLHNRPGRVTAVALIAVTACKGFLYDMGSLGGLYRVSSLVGLAISLSLVALALQKFVLRPTGEPT